MQKWIDCDDPLMGPGFVGYLVETLNTSTGRTVWSLRERPLRTNQSHEPRLDGWCGETDNRSRYARGVARVVRYNLSGDRALVESVDGATLIDFLNGDGHPDLVPVDGVAAVERQSCT